MYNKDDFRNWIISNHSPNYEIDQSEYDLRLNSQYARGEINFVESMGYQIIEMKIFNYLIDDYSFYLHFELIEEHRAKQLFKEMETAFLDIEAHHDERVLICCTGGLTSSYFAMSLNETIKSLNINMTFDAISYTKLDEVIDNYDAILLAPQIKTEKEKLRKLYKGKYITDIPAKIFATYNSFELIELLKAKKFYYRKKQEVKAKQAIKEELYAKSKVLSVLVDFHQKPLRITIRYYVGKEMLDEVNVIKNDFTIKDLLETLITGKIRNNQNEVDFIALCMPGIFNDGKMYMSNSFSVQLDKDDDNSSLSSYNVSQEYKDKQIHMVDIKKMLEDEFKIPVIVNNSTAMAALGFYYSQDKFRNIIYHSQHPDGGAGLCHVKNGEIIKGKHNVIGELNFLTPILKHGKDVMNNPFDQKSIINTLSDYLVTSIVYTDPDAICINSSLDIDIDQLKKRVKKYIPEDFIHNVFFISEEDRSEYVHLGNLMMIRKVFIDKNNEESLI